MSVESRQPWPFVALALPAEIAFLVAHGVPHRRLAEARDLARAAGTDAATALLRAGLIDEERFYRALAATLGVPYLASLPPLHPSLAYPDCLRIGRVRLDGEPDTPLFAVAPPGETVEALLASGAEARRALAVTTPTRLRETVLAVHGHWIAKDAAETLRRRAPHWAYTPNDGLGLAATLIGTVLLVAVLHRFAPALGTLLVALANAGCLAMTAFRIGAPMLSAPTRMPEAIPRAPDRDLPVYTVVVALYHEARMVRRLLAALRALDYPDAKLDLKVVVEEDDAGTRAALAAATLPARFEVIVAPPGQPRTKPRALNVVLPLARGDLLVVYDAEDVPDPGQLRDAAAIFARVSPRTACLQGRLVVENRDHCWLTRLFALEYAALFDVLGPALAAWRLPTPLGGTSTHFRIATLRALHGWDAWNVTEDADLGIRLALAGYHVGDLPSATGEEGVREVGAFLRQRSRWMKGFMQTAIVHARRPRAAWRALGPLAFFGAVSVILGTVVSALSYPVLTLWALCRVWGTLAHPDALFVGNLPSALGLVLIAAGIAAMILPAYAGCRRRGWHDLAPLCLAMPFYYGLVSAGAWWGLWSLLRAPSYWAKTEHGLPPRIRRRAPDPSPRHRVTAAGSARSRSGSCRP